MSSSLSQHSSYLPGYCTLSPAKWQQREQALLAHLQNCLLCPHKCLSHRLKGERGRCRVGDKPLLAEACVHRGEEPVFGGNEGTGNLFFSGCQLGCVFCQNFQISQSLRGQRISAPGRLAMILRDDEKAQDQSWQSSPEQIAAQMLELQNQGVRHIGWVTPTPQLPWLLQALHIASDRGLNLPIIFNSGGYESPEILAILDGVIDIYLPDFKYVSPEISGKLSAAPDYAKQAVPALKEMARQQNQSNKLAKQNALPNTLQKQGSLWLDAAGMAQRGLLVRHLILPGYVTESIKVLDSLVENLGCDLSLSLMAQYQPVHHAKQIGGSLARPLRRKEYQRVLDHAESLGFSHIIGQELEAREHYLPDFSQSGPVFEN